jgi:hypothetical protein
VPSTYSERSCSKLGHVLWNAFLPHNHTKAQTLFNVQYNKRDVKQTNHSTAQARTCFPINEHIAQTTAAEEKKKTRTHTHDNSNNNDTTTNLSVPNKSSLFNNATPSVRYKNSDFFFFELFATPAKFAKAII